MNEEKKEYEEIEKEQEVPDTEKEEIKEPEEEIPEKKPMSGIVKFLIFIIICILIICIYLAVKNPRFP